MVKPGLNYAGISHLNSSLVMTSISPFGQTGPYRDYKGCDLITSHMSGEAFGNPAEGVDDLEKYSPLRGPANAADFMTGLTAAVSTMAEVLSNQLHGGGRHIDISAQEAVTSVSRQELAFCMCEVLLPTRELGRKRRGGILYPCKDGFVCIWIGPHWNKMIEMMGKPDWTQSDMFRNPMARGDYVLEFDRLVALWTKEYTMAEIDKAAIAYGVPCSPVRSVKEVVSDEQLAYREYFVDVDHPAAGPLQYPGAPYKLSATPWRISRPAPLLGEHNAEVYCGILDYNEADLEKLKSEVVI